FVVVFVIIVLFFFFFTFGITGSICHTSFVLTFIENATCSLCTLYFDPHVDVFMERWTFPLMLFVQGSLCVDDIKEPMNAWGLLVCLLIGFHAMILISHDLPLYDLMYMSVVPEEQAPHKPYCLEL
ncbi:hypothetical protein ACJX0J_027339, partial [Zea mays]